MINRETIGLKMSSFIQKDEDYYDDLNFLSESENDLVVIEEIFLKFENVSGAILSRSKRLQIDGFGSMERQSCLASTLVTNQARIENIWIPNNPCV